MKKILIIIPFLLILSNCASLYVGHGIWLLNQTKSNYDYYNCWSEISDNIDIIMENSGICKIKFTIIENDKEINVTESYSLSTNPYDVSIIIFDDYYAETTWTYAGETEPYKTVDYSFYGNLENRQFDRTIITDDVYTWWQVGHLNESGYEALVWDFVSDIPAETGN
jgi:hypothetical protein